MKEAGWYHGEGDPPGTVRYWDGTRWDSDPVLQPTAAPSPPSPYGTTSGNVGTPEVLPYLSPVEWYKRPWNKFADFSGRASQAEYWWFWLGNWVVRVGMLVAVLVVAILSSVGSEALANIVLGLGFFAFVFFEIAATIATVAAAVRRLHDSNQSGWMILISFIPFGGFYVLYLLIRDGDPGPNQYGPPIAVKPRVAIPVSPQSS